MVARQNHVGVCERRGHGEGGAEAVRRGRGRRGEAGSTVSDAGARGVRGGAAAARGARGGGGGARRRRQGGAARARTSLSLGDASRDVRGAIVAYEQLLAVEPPDSPQLAPALAAKRGLQEVVDARAGGGERVVLHLCVHAMHMPYT